MLIEQLHGALTLGLAERELRACTVELGLRALQLSLVRTLVDGEEDVALLDLVAGIERHAGDVTADARTKLDALDGRELAGELVEIRDGPADHLRHAHLGCLRSGGSSCGFVARASCGNEQ